MILAFFAVFSTKFEKHQQLKADYRIMFILGVSWLPIGISTSNHAFTAFGMLFLIAAVAKKKEWKIEPRWKSLTYQQKKTKSGSIVLMALILILSVFYILMQRFEV
ncbi:MAG: hypothetical protein JEZ03_15120 [Bacteroidales bacterium]|nr:hypothetical protein [Bacteroidales bacterium]